MLPLAMSLYLWLFPKIDTLSTTAVAMVVAAVAPQNLPLGGTFPAAPAGVA
jgi:hypothetical protein